VSDKEKYYKTAFALAIFTIVYNLIEGIIAMFLGAEDDSLTLFGFGIDSFIEFISGLGIIQMVIRIRENPDTKRGEFEKTALKITGVSFYLLVAGLISAGAYNAYKGINPSTTFWGVVISVVSIIVMLILLRGKMRTGKALNSEAILADAGCTRVCIYMSLVLLASSGIYQLTRWPYIDVAGSAGLAWFSFLEGKECFEKARSDKYCACEH